jgi:hypothetical protein
VKTSWRLRQFFVALLALSPMVFVLEPIRNLIESRMLTHMLLQFPLLLASGWMFGIGTPRWRSWIDGVDAIDAHGLFAWSFATCALAFWMIPTALDLALLSEPVRWAKYSSLWLSGLLVGRTWRSLSIELATFFLGMLIWMMATVGMLYETMSQRLCVSYLLEEQRWTGIGLVVAALLLSGAALSRLPARLTATDV